MNSRITLGKYGEQLVAQELRQQGLSILEQNYRKRYGEIDLIAGNSEFIMFIEVKTRKHHYGEPTEVITRTKQKKIITVAKEYLVEQNITNKICRFDIALVTYAENKKATIVYIPNAFSE